jgi:RimJ/RimL family protein N-acetyltransferase
MPEIRFRPLAETDFPLLLKWLEEPHVKAWWNQGTNWTLDLVKQKYTSYTKGYKLDQGVKKPIHAYLALIDEVPIAYVQFYNAWDFERDDTLDPGLLPKSLAALDIYIGEPGFLKKGFAPIILQKFLSEKVKPLFVHCLVDPDIKNTVAIRAYEKAGFKAIETPSKNVCWMLADLMPKELFKWVDDYFASQGKKIAHFEEVRIVPWSQVYRVTTSQNQVCYLKRMSPPFAIEAKLLQYWAIQQNHSVPRILATHPESNCFLMQDSGECLRPLMKQHYRVDWTCQALQTYAQLQQNEALQIEVLFALGVPDWRLAKLPDLYAELIARKDFLKAEGLSEQEINALGALKTKVQDICAQLLKYSIPETIEHGDFHDHNILRQGERLIVNDWGDAVISHPFFSLVSFLDSARRNHGILEGSEVYLKLRDAYLEAWSDYASEAQRLECFELAKQIGVIKFVISFYRVALCPGMAHLGQYQGTIAEGLRGFLR